MAEERSWRRRGGVEGAVGGGVGGQEEMEVPELHLHQAELPEVSAELEGPQDGVLLRQHDEGRAGQTAVDVQTEPYGQGERHRDTLHMNRERET